MKPTPQFALTKVEAFKGIRSNSSPTSMDLITGMYMWMFFVVYICILSQCTSTLDILFCQFTTFIRVSVTFVFGLQTLDYCFYLRENSSYTICNGLKIRVSRESPITHCLRTLDILVSTYLTETHELLYKMFLMPIVIVLLKILIKVYVSKLVSK